MSQFDALDVSELLYHFERSFISNHRVLPSSKMSSKALGKDAVPGGWTGECVSQAMGRRGSLDLGGCWGLAVGLGRSNKGVSELERNRLMKKGKELITLGLSVVSKIFRRNVQGLAMQPCGFVYLRGLIDCEWGRWKVRLSSTYCRSPDCTETCFVAHWTGHHVREKTRAIPNQWPRSWGCSTPKLFWKHQVMYHTILYIKGGK